MTLPIQNAICVGGTRSVAGLSGASAPTTLENKRMKNKHYDDWQKWKNYLICFPLKTF